MEIMPYPLQLIPQDLSVASHTKSHTTHHFSIVTMPPTGVGLGTELTNPLSHRDLGDSFPGKITSVIQLSKIVFPSLAGEAKDTNE